jgi:hypothetical protein
MGGRVAQSEAVSGVEELFGRAEGSTERGGGLYFRSSQGCGSDGYFAYLRIDVGFIRLWGGGSGAGASEPAEANLTDGKDWGDCGLFSSGATATTCGG